MNTPSERAASNDKAEKCYPCGKAFRRGDLFRRYDDVGPAHVDCDDPSGGAFKNPQRIEAEPEEWEPGEAPTFLKTYRFEP